MQPSFTDDCKWADKHCDESKQLSPAHFSGPRVMLSAQVSISFPLGSLWTSPPPLLCMQVCGYRASSSSLGFLPSFLCISLSHLLWQTHTFSTAPCSFPISPHHD